MADLPTSGRRRAAETRRRLPSPVTVLAATIPLLTVAALAAVRPAPVPGLDRAPTEAPLVRSTIVCPPAIPGAEGVQLASADGASGELAVRSGRRELTVPVVEGTGRAAERASLVATGEGDVAPGLLGTRAGDGTATVCSEPQPVQWFTGLGAGAEHTSVLALTNPDRGPAVADVTVLGEEGVLDVPELRGVRVTGGRTASFDLAEVTPSRGVLAVGVTVTRGRLGVQVADVEDEIGGGGVRREWIPAQAAPAETSYVVGLGGKPGDRLLTLANPGDSEVRVEVRLVSGESEFAPAGLEEVTVDPASVTRVDLTDVLRGPGGGGVRGLRLDATGPVTASLRTRVGQDLSYAVAGSEVSTAGAALPVGAKRLVAAGATAPGVLRWRAWDRLGRELAGERVEVDAGTAVRVPVPARAERLSLEVDRTLVVAAVELGPPGLAVLPLAPLVTTSEVPAVRPALR